MRQIETTYRTISVAAGAGSRRSSQRSPSDSASQVIAEREYVNTQRSRRRTVPLEALRTYDANGRLRVLRVPPGYRMDILA